ncbi:hypothetical protein RSOL_290910 [Rhizoctonia solani AG-3 Rhs1AP]|uniref:Transposase family Tnp2 protein n=1 Tax=Rhizoctonia solani AG-3 Rhs1AP TaxID=1086054 RepID=A0A0A1UJG2_9AGAM|nr:hypothetical protein RSOL_290910 [Rhizoctonia solani AG-3 Rhs1AP]
MDTPMNASLSHAHLNNQPGPSTPAPGLPSERHPTLPSTPLDDRIIFEEGSAQPPCIDPPSEDNYRSTYIRTEIEGGYEYTHPTAGRTFGKSTTRWGRALEENRMKRKGNRWGIFGSERQWQIAFWMGMTKASQRNLDELLATQIMNGLSFRRAKKLFRIVERKMALFGGPVWHEVEVVLDDAPADSHTLWYRDLEAVLDDLMGRPTLSGKMAYSPKVQHDQDDQTRRYGNVWTGKRWNRLQGTVPQGSTIGGVMIASDSTQLSTHSGNVSAHAVYVTLANIDKSLRNQTSQDAWVLVAYIPVSKFPATMIEHEGKSKDYKTKLMGLLNRRLLHRCLSIVTRPLRRTEPHRVTDPDGYIRQVVYKLMAYIADFEEQTRLTGIGSKSCPHCMANASNLGSAEVQSPRTSASILQAIEDVKQVLAEKYPEDRYDAMDFLKECKAFGLNGVDKPFWRLIPDGDICEILSPDLLHGFHKFFYDHIFQWNSLSLGESEMDARMRSQIRLTGDRIFRNGVSHLSQTTMKEHRDLQRVHMAVMAGAPIPDARRVTSATRSILDCIYLAQFTSHSDSSLEAYRRSHEQFHSQKQIWLDNKSRLGKDAMRKEAMRNDGAEVEESAKENARNHFNIPKLHILRHLADHVELKGTADNYTTEAMEHLHIDLVKNAYRASNRRNWKEQTTRWLTRREKLKDFASWMNWNNTDATTFEDPRVLEEDWADEVGDDEPDDENNNLPDEETTNDFDAAIYADEDGNVPTTEGSSQWPGLESLWAEAEDIEEQGQELGDKESEVYGNPEQSGQVMDIAGEHPETTALGKRKRGRQNVTLAESPIRLRKPVAPPTGLTCFQSIRLRPLIARIPIQQAIDRYGTPDLLPELQRHPYAASLINSPDEHSLIDIWPYIRVQPPPRPHAPTVGLQRMPSNATQIHGTHLTTYNSYRAEL